MSTKSLLLELLLSGFFAVDCIKARAGDLGKNIALSPWNMFRLKDRLERLSVTRWQWFSMVLVVIVARLQSGVPLMAELTVAAQLVIFLALPVYKQQNTLKATTPARRKGSTPLAARRVSPGKA